MKSPNWEAVCMWAGTQLKTLRIETRKEFGMWFKGFSIACVTPPLQDPPKLLKS